MAGGAADGLYTYDIPLADGGPRVPDVEDLGGVDIVNGTPPPTKGADRDADMDNVQTQTLAGLCRMTPTCRVSVEYSGSYAVVAVDAMGTAVAAGAFSFTPNGTGDVTMEWTACTLPPQTRKPRVYIPDAVGHGYAIAGVDEVRVYTRNESGTATNLAFIVEIF